MNENVIYLFSFVVNLGFKQNIKMLTNKHLSLTDIVPMKYRKCVEFTNRLLWNISQDK